MATHAYWRVNVSANNGAVHLSVADLEFRASIGGADQCSGGTPVYSSQTGGSSDGWAVCAFDAVTNSGWVTNATSTGYIGYNFASAVQVAQVAITGSWDSPTRSPKDFTIEHSDDGSAWTVLGTVTNQTSWATLEQRLFAVIFTSLAGNITESLAITDWRVSVLNCNTHLLEATSINTSTTYSIGLSTAEPCLIMIAPKIDYQWSVGKVTTSGDFVVAVSPDTTPHLWKCTTAGTTHATTEPTWNLSSTTTDNTTTWTYVGKLVNPVTIGPKIPS